MVPVCAGSPPKAGPPPVENPVTCPSSFKFRNGVIFDTGWYNNYTTSMINLRSKITQKVLAFIFLQNEEFYARELARRLDLDHGNLIKKLHELEKLGLLTSQAKGQEKYYKLNTRFPLLKEYRVIVHKTFGFEDKLREALHKTKQIEHAILFGSYVKNKMDKSSDIDLLVIGKHSTISLQKNIAKLQKEYDREINVISMHSNEFNHKQKDDLFLKKILKSPKIELV